MFQQILVWFMVLDLPWNLWLCMIIHFCQVQFLFHFYSSLLTLALTLSQHTSFHGCSPPPQYPLVPPPLLLLSPNMFVLSWLTCFILFVMCSLCMYCMSKWLVILQWHLRPETEWNGPYIVIIKHDRVRRHGLGIAVSLTWVSKWLSAASVWQLIKGYR